MDNHEFLQMLYSTDEVDISGALIELSGKCKEGFQLPPEMITRIRSLMTYHNPDQSDPDQPRIDESIRWHAISTLGVFYRLSEILPDFVVLLRAKSDSDSVLKNLVDAVSAIGAEHSAHRTEAMKILAETALDTGYARSVRDEAYLKLLRLDNKLSIQDWGKIQTGALPFPAYNEAWLRSHLVP